MSFGFIYCVLAGQCETGNAVSLYFLWGLSPVWEMEKRDLFKEQEGSCGKGWGSLLSFITNSWQY